ncbi:MAG: hypothetical protein KAJ19_22950 [Gammaproteobacteria bacterium]|nr:hypothetical protein [Gammaproteobacteria bacterium]
MNIGQFYGRTNGYYASTPTTAENLEDMGFSDQQVSLSNGVLISVYTAVATFTLDGTTPAATTGHQLAAGEFLYIPGTVVRGLKFFSAAGTVCVTLLTGV